jgi:organic hydroperoxide reductase OsmC/OhrA
LDLLLDISVDLESTLWPQLEDVREATNVEQLQVSEHTSCFVHQWLWVAHHFGLT